MQLKETLHHFLQLDLVERTNYLKENSNELLNHMLSEIGSVDPELRDQFIYRTFNELLANHLLNDLDIIMLFEQAISDDYLFYNMGEQNTDSVFTRSFTALLVADLLAIDSQKQILPSTTLAHFFDRVVNYLSNEKDTRVFVDGKGWAHSIAYGADLLTACIQHPAFEIKMAPRILQALKDALWKGYVYTDDEEERFVNILEALIIKGMPEEVFIEWTEQLFDKLDMHLFNQGYNEDFFKGRTCTLNLMKTFYFALKIKNWMPTLQGVIYGQIGKWFKLR